QRRRRPAGQHTGRKGDGERRWGGSSGFLVVSGPGLSGGAARRDVNVYMPTAAVSCSRRVASSARRIEGGWGEWPGGRVSGRRVSSRSGRPADSRQTTPPVPASS